eukprot:6914343-Prymnesium_polylepis.1
MLNEPFTQRARGLLTLSPPEYIVGRGGARCGLARPCSVFCSMTRNAHGSRTITRESDPIPTSDSPQA